jgi:2-oxo-4-hydroxy-4-carboxy-5-ureidoimidazoline decarboxylase
MSTPPPMSIDEVNHLDATSFSILFGDVAEHSPWVAESAAHARPYANREAMIQAFVDAVSGRRDRSLVDPAHRFGPPSPAN